MKEKNFADSMMNAIAREDRSNIDELQETIVGFQRSLNIITEELKQTQDKADARETVMLQLEKRLRQGESRIQSPEAFSDVFSEDYCSHPNSPAFQKQRNINRHMKRSVMKRQRPTSGVVLKSISPRDTKMNLSPPKSTRILKEKSKTTSKIRFIEFKSPEQKHLLDPLPKRWN